MQQLQPLVTLTPSGVNPSQDITRVVQRYKNVCAALEKNTLKEFRRKELEIERQKLSNIIEEAKAMFAGV